MASVACFAAAPRLRTTRSGVAAAAPAPSSRSFHSNSTSRRTFFTATASAATGRRNCRTSRSSRPAVPELQALVGLIGHPTDALDLYAYAGIEQAAQTSFTVNGTLPFGYGNPLYNNSGCLHEGSALYAENTSRVWQISGGAWYSLYKGSYGTLRIGAQGSYTQRSIFRGIGGSPSTNEGMFFTSLRYYPPPWP